MLGCYDAQIDARKKEDVSLLAEQPAALHSSTFQPVSGAQGSGACPSAVKGTRSFEGLNFRTHLMKKWIEV